MNATSDSGITPRAFLVFLELKPPQRRLEKLNTEIKALGNWWHCIAGLWIVLTKDSVETIHDRLRPHLEADDALLVLETSGDCDWCGFEGQVAAWLKDHLLRRGASPRARAPHKITGSQSGNGAHDHASRQSVAAR